ncbi:MAG TPA: helix-turn-helix transcriptional regulator [Candidatus Mediterraneibacter excrementigallinarum]|nr:helix-turn-helix transcriptional regulator [Candidatus Mediterraneibacter excrementigallinarum]
MEIGTKLKSARKKCGLTQEKAAEAVGVSRQTISNWENEKSYPDIVSVIRLSSLYSVSLDELLKGDEDMIEHLEESTNVVNSNKKLIAAALANILLLIVFAIFSGVIPENRFFLVGIFALSIVSASALLYQIIRKI